MDLYRLIDSGPFRDPVLVLALDGWVNAGSAGTTAAEALAGDGSLVAVFDSDALFDYRQNRPTLDFMEGVIQSVEWPELVMKVNQLEAHDILVVTGIEPNWNWQRLGASVAGLAERLGVTRHISLGGIPWATPHTRPVSIITTASQPDLLPPGEDRPDGLLRVPGSAVSTIERAVALGGIASVGFWARVPHYVGTTYYAAALALVERVSKHLGEPISPGRLPDDAVDQRVQLDAIVEARPEVKQVVTQLESMVDEQGVVSGEQLAAEIERFLRQQGDESLG